MWLGFAGFGESFGGLLGGLLPPLYHDYAGFRPNIRGYTSIIRSPRTYHRFFAVETKRVTYTGPLHHAVRKYINKTQ